MGEAAGEQQDGGGVEEGSGGVDRAFEVLGEASAAIDPGEEALDHPAAGLDGEADLAGVLSDDLDGDGRGVRDPVAGVAAIGEDRFDKGEGVARGLQGAAAVPVLDAPRPSVSTRAWRLRPLIFLPAS